MKFGSFPVSKVKRYKEKEAAAHTHQRNSKYYRTDSVIVYEANEEGRRMKGLFCLHWLGKTLWALCESICSAMWLIKA